MSQIFY